MSDAEIEILREIAATLQDIKRGIGAIEEAVNVLGWQIGALSAEQTISNLPSGRRDKIRLRPDR